MHTRVIGFFLVALLWTAPVPVASAGGKSHYTRHRSTYCYTCPRDSRGRIKRSSSARRTFLKSQGLTHTPRGCQVDHVTPLARGGADTPANMQLLCGDALKAKERRELK